MPHIRAKAKKDNNIKLDVNNTIPKGTKQVNMLIDKNNKPKLAKIPIKYTLDTTAIIKSSNIKANMIQMKP